jgi:aromatic-L-amino-acid decarboxylase
MRPEELDATIADDLEQGVVPVAVVANGGTTLTGAVDPIADLAEVAERHGVWLHVDGAYGLAAAGVPSRARLFEGLERADSVTLDAHKWLGVQKSCSLVMVRDATALEQAFGHEERYMLHQDGTPNAVDRTVEYSRPVRSLKLWLAFRVYGAGAFREWIEHTLRLAERFRDLVDADPAFELLHDPTLSTVCFRHVARDSDEHNRRLAIAAQQDGRVYIAPAVVDDMVCLRACFVNFHTREEDADAVLDILRELGEAQRRRPKTVV